MKPSTPTNFSSEGAPNPGLVMDALDGYRRSAALKGAIDLDLFSVVGQGNHKIPEIAKECGGDLRATRILCDYLVLQGFLVKRENEYFLSPTAAVFLDKKSPRYQGGMAKFVNSAHLLSAFRDVADLIRKGTTLLENSGTIADEFDGWVDFARLMGPSMMPAADFIGAWSAKILSRPIKVLDIAAGHGLFGIAVARENPNATIVAQDWGKVLEVAKVHADEAGVGDRYRRLAGDALKIDYGSGYDLILVTNFFHHFDKPTCQMVMDKAKKSLNPGGFVLTLEFVPNEDRVSPPPAAAFSFMMLATTPKGEAYTYGEYQEMFAKAGLQTRDLYDVPNTPLRLIVAT